MRKAFTLIELLVVLVILALVMAIVVPKGSKMLQGFKKNLDKLEGIQKLAQERSICFLSVKAKTIDILGVKYLISDKGVVIKYEKSNDNH